MTLTQAAKLTKQSMVFSASVLFIILLGWLGYRYYLTHIYVPPPPVEIKPDTKFGVLPSLKLPESTLSASNYAYVLDTPTGNLPDKIPKIMKVYFAPHTGTTLLALDRATKLASDLEFVNGPKVISPIEYRFLDKDGGELIVNLDNGNFHFKKVLVDANLLDPIQETGQKISADFVNFLGQKGLLKDELRDGPANVIFNDTGPEKNKTAVVSIWPHSLESFPVVTASSRVGLIQATVVSSQKFSYKYLNLDYIFWPISQTISGTYPIRTAEEAFDQLKTGEAVVIEAPNSAKISINSIYLAYFQPKEYVLYIQPVYVFKGKDFLAYLPAVRKQFIETQTNTSPSR